MKAPRFSNTACLSEEDFYCYVTRSEGKRATLELTHHLSSCLRCREELAGMIQLLSPEPDTVAESQDEPSPLEIEQTLELIQKATQRKERRKIWARSWYAYAAAAAAVVLLITGGSLTLTYFINKMKSDNFYSQALSQLQEVYAPQSPSGMRLELPFQASPARRDLAGEEALSKAENFFHQALAVRSGIQEAHLGLGYVYLSKAQFSRAKEEFQTILAKKQGDRQALLGRAVSLYEEGLATKDPVARTSRFGEALADFESILKRDPAYNVARYNKILTLYETGRHKEALQEIDHYLSLDSTSIWAERLRNLQTRMRLNRSGAVEKELNRAALARDAPALETIAHLAPHQIPSALRSALQQSLQIASSPAPEGTPDPSALFWASEKLESAYSAATGDHSYARLLQFYAGLSPPERRIKKSLDARLRSLINLHRQETQPTQNNLQAALLGTLPLIPEFEKLHDDWQLVNLYHLRGECSYYGKADFTRALDEYEKMLGWAERTGAPDLIAKALGALATPYIEKRSFDEAQACLNRMKTLAVGAHMVPWAAYVSRAAGDVYLKLNLIEKSLAEFSAALELNCRLFNEEAVQVLENLGAAMEKLGRFKDARRFYQDALQTQESYIKEGTVRSATARMLRRSNLFHKQGKLAFQMDELKAAKQFFISGLESTKPGMRELIGRNRLGLVQVYLRENQIERADQELRAVRGLSSIGEFPELDWEASFLRGKIFQTAGDIRPALTHFQRSVQILEDMRKRISSTELKQSFLTRRFDPYQETVSLLYHAEGDKQKALDYVDRAKSMNLREYLGDPGYPSLRTLTSSWKSISGLPAGLVVVEYFATAQELFVFIADSQFLDAVSLKIPRAELKNKIRNFRESIESNDAPSFELLSRRLYDELVQPALARIEARNVNSIAIFPDGALHMLPFGSLKDSDGHYLLEKYALSYAPSQSIFSHCLSVNRAGATSRSRSILLLDGTSNLPGASNELAHLANIYGKNATLVHGSELASLGERIRNYDIIHFSGHARTSNGRPVLVFRVGGGESYLDPSIIGGWKLINNRLVSLAGCNTGIGPQADGEIPWGLLPAFLNAGAPAILVSLVPVDDSATQHLTSRFYNLLATGSMGKAKALQQAQLSLLRDDRVPANRRPIAWSPFVLVGDPR